MGLEVILPFMAFQLESNETIGTDEIQKTNENNQITIVSNRYYKGKNYLIVDIEAGRVLDILAVSQKNEFHFSAYWQENAKIKNFDEGNLL